MEELLLHVPKRYSGERIDKFISECAENISRSYAAKLAGDGMVFKNGNKVIYAKNNKETGEPEPNTQPFKNDDTVMLELSENFKVGDIDKWTVVVWVEGDDPECKDDLIGGEIKMHMTLTEEHILQNDEVPQNKR